VLLSSKTGRSRESSNLCLSEGMKIERLDALHATWLVRGRVWSCGADLADRLAKGLEENGRGDALRGRRSPALRIFRGVVIV